MAKYKERAISERLVTKVADRKDTNPMDLQPSLYEVVDLEALDTLFASRSSGMPRDTNGRVEFTYEGLRVRVEGEGTIDINDTEGAE